MITIITQVTVEASRANLAIESGLDLIMVLLLIFLLLFKEYFTRLMELRSLTQIEEKKIIGRLFNIGILPLLYIFSYILIYKAIQFIP